MPNRKTLLAILAILLAPWPGRAQVQAPTPVEEDREEPPGDDAAPRRPGRRTTPPREPATVPLGNALTTTPAPAGLPSPAATNAPDRIPAPLAPSPPPPPERPTARAIEPVHATYAAMMERWAERRTAQREQDPARAARAAAAILEGKRLLAIENLPNMATAVIRDYTRALEGNLPTEALASAELAVQLAPDLADAHLAVARARLARNSSDLSPALSALGDAVVAAFHEPHTVRAFLGDLFSALLAAVFTAASATLLILLLRTLPLFLHDFHHLPLLRGSPSIQTGFLGLVIITLPWAFGLGPFLILATAVAVAWLYLTQLERGVATLALALVVALPWAAEGAAHLTAWTGSLAEVVYEIEHGAPDDQEVAEIAARAAEAPPVPQLAAALGRHYKRRGDLEKALTWYREAQRADERAAEIQVNVGNVLFIQGDVDGAKAAYLAASDRGGGDLTVLAAAHYDLSKLFLRSSDIEKASAARDRAEREGGAFLARHGSDDDFAANRYLVDVPVPDARIAELAVDDGSPQAMRDAVRSRLAGPLPHAAWPWAPVGLLAVLWLLALAGPRLAPSSPCEKCGRPACRRCDGASSPLCGQCINVYVKKGVVDARDRLLKEAAVRRHRQVDQVVTRVLAVLGGGAGHVFAGLAGRGFAVLTALFFAVYVVWFWRGIMPPPQPSPYVLVGKVLVAVPLGLLVYLLAVRDLFRRTEG